MRGFPQFRFAQEMLASARANLWYPLHGEGVLKPVQTSELWALHQKMAAWANARRAERGYAAAESSFRHECRCLHFLHGMGPPLPDGAVIASYVIHYADGERTEVPVVCGEDVRDRVVASDPVPTTPRAVSVWPRPDEDPECRLFCRSWQNPPGRTWK